MFALRAPRLIMCDVPAPAQLSHEFHRAPLFIDPHTAAGLTQKSKQRGVAAHDLALRAR
jgi:hypothetical protein